MPRDFNSDMFSAILKANENAMGIIKAQLEAAQKQSKRKDIVYGLIIAGLLVLCGCLTYAYHQKKAVMTLDYDQDTQESTLTDSNVSYNNTVMTD